MKPAFRLEFRHVENPVHELRAIESLIDEDLTRWAVAGAALKPIVGVCLRALAAGNVDAVAVPGIVEHTERVDFDVVRLSRSGNKQGGELSGLLPQYIGNPS